MSKHLFKQSGKQLYTITEKPLPFEKWRKKKINFIEVLLIDHPYSLYTAIV